MQAFSSENKFSYFSTKTYVVDNQKNRLSETVLLIMLKLMGKKIFTILRKIFLLSKHVYDKV